MIGNNVFFGSLIGVFPFAALAIFILPVCQPFDALVATATFSAPPPDLPDRVYFRTTTESFNRTYYLALRDGRIWYKENEEVTGKEGEWRLLGKTGKPHGNMERFGEPAKIIGISADGIHLLAVAQSGVFYRGTNLTNDVSNRFDWDDRWGWWGAHGPGLKDEVHGRAWSVSDAFPLHLKYFEDGNGQKQGIGFGVAHLYYLSADGTKIYFNDWWLPADWSRQFTGPLRGTFKAIAMSASGSTIFIIDENGRMFTRMYDFDMSGENPLLTYSYIKIKKIGTTRKLPLPDWMLQPSIKDGNITGKITIFQNGEGNAARVLRVEGTKDGKTGFYHKNIFDKKWTFQETGLPTVLPFLEVNNDPVPQDTASPFDKELTGTLTAKKQDKPLELEFLNFNIACPPAKVMPLMNGKPIRQLDGKDLVLEFYHTQTLVADIRAMDFWDDGQKADVWGSLLIPEQIYGRISDDQKVFLRTYFKNRKAINFIGKADRESIEMDEITTFQKGPTWVPLFMVPGNEKSRLSHYHLSAALK